jgi:tetratricopeptide (TPR) repeat protein
MSSPLVSQKLQAGIAKKREGNYAEALKLYREAGNIDPTNIDVYGNSARIYAGLLDFDLCLRHVLTRQHLGQLLVGMPSNIWQQMLDYFDVEEFQKIVTNSYIGQLQSRFDLFGRHLLVNFDTLYQVVSEDSYRGNVFRYMVGDYQTTRIIGLAFLMRPENDSVLVEMGMNRKSIEQVLRVYLGGQAATSVVKEKSFMNSIRSLFGSSTPETGTVHFVPYNAKLDPVVALFGLNILYKNRLEIPNGSTQVIESVPKVYLAKEVKLNWSI